MKGCEYKRLGCFFVVGCINTLVGFGLYYAFLFLRVPYLLASGYSWLLSVFIAHLLNRLYVFSGQKSFFQSLLRTYILYFSSFIMGMLLLAFFVEVVGLSPWIVPWLNLLITIPLNFIANKYWVFGKP